MRTLQELIDTYGLPSKTTGICAVCQEEVTKPVWAFSHGGSVIEEARHMLEVNVLSREELDLMIDTVVKGTPA